jgi:hypothetical protein
MILGMKATTFYKNRQMGMTIKPQKLRLLKVLDVAL